MSAATSYVALSRHRDRAALFVTGVMPAERAAQPSELDRLARQMARIDDRRSASQFHLAPAQPATPGLWPPRRLPPAPVRSRDSATLAAAQVRAAAAQFDFQHAALPERAQLSRLAAAPRGRGAPDAALSAAQVRAAADMLAELIVKEGGIADIVTDLVQDGLAWWQRVAHRAAELVEDVRETVLGWREQVRQEREERHHDTALDFD